jgi:hypothetical protein
MILLTTRRCFGRWLLGLFLIAQVAGMVPLVAVHLEHIAAAERDAADDAGAHVAEHAHHHHVHHGSGQHDHGAADPNDQCCTLHHLAGVLPHPLGGHPKDFPAATNISLPPAALALADQVTLERPPKFLLSV